MRKGIAIVIAAGIIGVASPALAVGGARHHRGRKGHTALKTSSLDHAREVHEVLPARTASAPTLAPGQGIPDATPAKRSLPQSVIDRVARSHRKEVRYCYDRIDGNATPSDVTLSLRVDIDVSGKVTGARSVDHEGVLADCLERAVARWQFPSATASSTVVLPFVFSSQQ
jgi:hypothetical protein